MEKETDPLYQVKKIIEAKPGLEFVEGLINRFQVSLDQLKKTLDGFEGNVTKDLRLVDSAGRSEGQAKLIEQIRVPLGSIKQHVTRLEEALKVLREYRDKLAEEHLKGKKIQ